MINYTYIRNLLQSMLTPHGFKKSGAGFYKVVGDVIQVVELQKYTFEVDGHKILNIRLGIVVPHLFQKAFKMEPDLGAHDGIINFYVDELMRNFEKKKGASKFWAIDDSFDAEDFKKSILDHVLPFFEKVHDLDSVIHFIETTDFLSKKFPATTMQLEELKKEMS